MGPWTYLLVTLAMVSQTFCKLDLATAKRRVDWTLTNKNGSISIPATVPGGVYTDLEKAGLIGDIVAGFNDKLQRWVAYDTWTYTGRFLVAPMELESEVIHLVFEGIDTVAFIELNGSPVGTTNNMFVRYVFDVKSKLQIGKNELKIQFVSPVEAAGQRSAKHFTAPACVPDLYHGECHANQLRKMQASFAWDWGPAFPSVGLWKPAYIELYSGAIIRSVTTHIEKRDAKWDVTIKAHLESSMEVKSLEGYLSASLTVDEEQSIRIGTDLEIRTKSDGTAVAELNMTVSENVVSLWWPNGYGNQSLYKLDVYLSTKGHIGEVSHKQISIGFRTIEVVEENASLYKNDTEAGKGLTFYFKVNGYPIFMKGSNWIPAHILPERGGDTKIVDNLLVSVKDTHMNMLRVWGGGIYEHDYFYTMCDQFGILVWQDLMFACSMYPTDPEFLDSVKLEIEQNVINLQHHPSIALWAGNNENEAALRFNWYGTNSELPRYKAEYVKLYVETIKPIVEGLDPGRRYLVSSPTNGLQSMKEGYIAENPYDSHYGDSHYYNYVADNWDQNIYPLTRFASEYGFQALPTVMTMKTATSDPKDFSVDSEYSKHRQHLANGYNFMETQMLKHLRLDKHDPKYFEKYVFYSQISQGMAVKAESEFYRQSQADWYTMGALYWQLNDVWQAPSWSSIEYTGNWKVLHYFAMTFFSPILVSPRLKSSNELDIYLLNDRFVPIENGVITVDVFKWDSMHPIRNLSYPANAAPLSAAKQDIKLDLWNQFNLQEVFLRFSVMVDGVPCAPYNYLFPKPLNSIVGFNQAPNVTVTVGKFPTKRADGTISYDIDITSDSIVLFLWLETTYSKGYFYDNGLIITDPRTKAIYINKKLIKVKDLQKSITVQYYVH